MVSEEPVVENPAGIQGDAADDHGFLRGPEGVVVNEDLRAGDVRAVLAVTAAVHVEAVAQRGAQFDVMPGLIATAWLAGACNGMAVVIKQVLFDQRRGDVMADAVTQSGVLAVVDETMMDVMSIALLKTDSGVAEGGDVAVVHFKPGVFR